MEQQTTTVENSIELEASDEFYSVFEGVGLEFPEPKAGSCTGCGNKYFFAVKLAL